MSKKKKVLVNPFEAMKKAAEDKFGGRVYTGHETDQLITGVKFPSLALMYLFDSTVLPLSKIIGIAGSPQAQKSSLSYEFSRMVMECFNGGTCYFETEGEKMSPSLISSIIGPELYSQGRFNIMQCPDMDLVQKLVTDQLHTYKKVANGETLAMILDSLAGAVGGETFKKIDKDGSYKRDFSETARTWTEYLKKLSADLVGWPVCFFLVNHMKETPNPIAFLPALKRTPGGIAQWFHSSAFFYVDKLQTLQRASFKNHQYDVEEPVEIRTLRLKCEKNSMGTNGRSINVNFLWFHVRSDDGSKRQISIFDWDASTTSMLLWMQSDSCTGVPRQRLRDICDVSAVKGLHTSKKLGLEGLSASDFGRAVHNNPEVMAKLIDFLSIKQHPVYAGTMPNPQKLEDPPEAVIPLPAAGPDVQSNRQLKSVEGEVVSDSYDDEDDVPGDMLEDMR